MKTKRNNLLTYKLHKEEETKLAQAAPAMISYNKHTNTHSLTHLHTRMLMHVWCRFWCRCATCSSASSGRRTRLATVDTVITFLIAGNKRRGEQRCARECAAKRTYLIILTELIYSCTFHTRS